MYNEDAAAFVVSYSGLFTADELQEIDCMMKNNVAYESKKFNWTPRSFNLERSNSRRLVCSRFRANDVCKEYSVSSYLSEVTEFTCNRRIALAGFKLELSSQSTALIQIRIEENDIECYDEQLTARFNEKRFCAYGSFLAEIKLDKWLLIRPYYTYRISVKFENQTDSNRKRLSSLRRKVHVDFDLVFDFKYSDGIVKILRAGIPFFVPIIPL